MRSNKTFGISFFVKKYQKDKNDLVPIYMRISADGKRLDMSVQRKIAIDRWDDVRGTVRGTKEDVRQLNFHLDQVRSRLLTCKDELDKEQKLITVETIKNRYLGEDEKGKTLLEVFTYHNEEMKHELQWGTQKNYYTTQKYVVMFLKKKFKRSDIYLQELGYSFIKEFERFLKNHQPTDHQKPMGQNTAMKHIERLRKVVHLAIKEEMLDRDPFQKFRAKFKHVKRGYLTADELQRIEKKEFSVGRLQQVKDLFIFSCYTGLSYAEVLDLEKKHITIGIDGGQWIEGQRRKSREFFAVPLLPQASLILQKYQNDPRAQAKGKLLPVLSNQKLNAYLKEIADLCAIEKNLTFHLARHTFATTVTLANGVPIETVGKMLGHASLRSTQIYAQVIRAKVSEDMTLLKNRLISKNGDREDATSKKIS